MIKGPLVYAAVFLAALLIILSAVMMLCRDFFAENPTLMMGLTGIVAIAVVAVLILMLVKMRKASE